MTQELLYRRRWFALKKCHVQFNLQSIVTDVSYLWQLISSFSLLCLCFSPRQWKNTDVWQRRICSRCSIQAFEGFYPIQGLSLIQSTQHRWQIQQSGSTGSCQQVCGFNGNCKTLKHPVPERDLTQVRLGRALKFCMGSRYVKEMKCMRKISPK